MRAWLGAGEDGIRADPAWFAHTEYRLRFAPARVRFTPIGAALRRRRGKSLILLNPGLGLSLAFWAGFRHVKEAA
jgi:hypothetical protein